MISAADIWPPSKIEHHPNGLARPRIAICGIAIESSTFSPHKTGLADFRVLAGDELLGRYPFFDHYADEAEWLPILRASSLPGGEVQAEVYEHFANRIVDGLKAIGPVDAVWLDIHGAMSVAGMSDAESHLAAAVREVVGDECFMAASMDLHGNVSRAFQEQLDLLTCYRMAPHEDEDNTRARLVYELLSILHGPSGADPVARRPWKAWVQVPVLLPGEKTSTRLEPAAGLYARLPEIDSRTGVIDSAYWVGYAWADEPRCQAAVVVNGWDAATARASAEELAAAIWDSRDEFCFVAPTGTLDECLAAATRPDARRPFVISDSGDNPTAGGCGDVTWTVTQLLQHPVRTSGLTVIHASMFDADAVAAAREAGVGGWVDVVAGAKIDSGPSGPVRLAGEVFSLTEGDPVAGGIAVIRVSGLYVIVTERRKPYHHISDFTELGLDPENADIVIVKIGYLEPELYELAADWLLALTPGGVDQDLLRLGHHRIERPMFPFDVDMPHPTLRALVSRGRGEGYEESLC